jgi:hypothetical protein
VEGRSHPRGPVQGVVGEDLQRQERLLAIARDELVGHEIDAVVKLTAVTPGTAARSSRSPSKN